jgi:hypothetical protein
MYITFIFRLPNGAKADKTFYGKYHTDYISPDHEGLDKEIRPYLIKGLSEYYKFEEAINHIQEVELNKKVKIGIISVSNDTYISIHSSNEEKRVFDFYCQKFTINHKINLEMYVFGKLIDNPELYEYIKISKDVNH